MGRAAKDALPRIPLFVYYFIKTSQGFLLGIPFWTQKSVFGWAAFLAKLTGFERRLKKYQVH